MSHSRNGVGPFSNEEETTLGALGDSLVSSPRVSWVLPRRRLRDLIAAPLPSDLVPCIAASTPELVHELAASPCCQTSSQSCYAAG